MPNFKKLNLKNFLGNTPQTPILMFWFRGMLHSDMHSRLCMYGYYDMLYQFMFINGFSKDFFSGYAPDIALYLYTFQKDQQPGHQLTTSTRTT